MSAESFGKVKIGVSHFRVSAVLAAVLAISAMGPPNANAISGPHCGTTVTASNTPFTLPWNVGPCTGTGAAVILIDPGVQLNLNGHRIIGTNPPTTGSTGVAFGR